MACVLVRVYCSADFKPIAAFVYVWSRFVEFRLYSMCECSCVCVYIEHLLLEHTRNFGLNFDIYIFFVLYRYCLWVYVFKLVLFFFMWIVIVKCIIQVRDASGFAPLKSIDDHQHIVCERDEISSLQVATEEISNTHTQPMQTRCIQMLYKQITSSLHTQNTQMPIIKWNVPIIIRWFRCKNMQAIYMRLKLSNKIAVIYI